MKRNSYSNWREDLREVMDTINPDTDEPERGVKDKKVKNKVVINPELKEAFEGIGATVLEVFELDEKIDLKKADMGDVVKDFYKSDAPQFKGKTKKERQKMAIAAKLTAERGGRKLGEEDEIEEAVYGGTPKKKEEPKDTRMTITSADKKGNTPAYQKFKSGDKRYKAADHMTKEEASMSPQELMLQKKKARIDRMIATRREQDLKKSRSGGQSSPTKAMGEEFFGEEESDRLKDRHLERGGMAARVDYTKPPKGVKTGPMTDAEKQKSRKASQSAMDFVKSQIRSKYGSKSIIDTKK